MFRSALREDLTKIRKLINPETEFYFGSSIKLEELLETTIYPTVFINAENSIIGFICFNVKANIPALDSCNWLDWINHNYKIPNIHYYNTMFIEYFVFELSTDEISLNKLIFEEIFLSMQITQNIIFIQPPLKREFSEFSIYSKFFKNFSTQYDRCLPPSGNKFYKLYVFNYDSFLKPLRCRLATAEDNDSIVDILHLRYPHLKSKHGEFYVAEEILKEKNNKQFILMERNDDEIYGVMLLNRNVDVDYLSKNFNLSLLNNLKKASDSPWKNLVVVKEAIRRDSQDFFDRNYFNLKRRVIEESRKYTHAKDDEQNLSDIVDIERIGSVKSLNETLMSLSFYQDEDVSFNPSHENILDYWESEKAKLVVDNPYIVVTEKNILISRGKHNAFLIELFSSNTALFENTSRRVDELLRAAFSLFPDMDYCVILINSMKSNDPLLQYFSFISPRPQCECENSLYISHRETVTNQVYGQEATEKDLTDIKRFLKYNAETNCSEITYIFELIMNELSNCQKLYHIICIRTCRALIGVVIMKVEEDLNCLRKYFNLDAFVNYDAVQDPLLHGRILYLLLNPLFDCNSKAIFRGLSRITGFKFFYYTIQKTNHTLNLYNNLLDFMYPVAPNIIYDIHKKDSEEELTFPLYFRSFKNSQIPLINIDIKICCIGFDNTCKGFLKSLIFDPKYINYRFTNITVITEPGEFECTVTDVYQKIYKLIKVNAFTTPEIIKRMGLMTWISCIGGKLVAIDKQSKTVFMRNFSKIKYDYLFLVCSIDHGYPRNLTWSSMYAPSNYDQINNAMTSALFYHKLNILKDFFKTGFDIIVYGSVLYSYSCLNFLLEQGIPGHWIHFVQLEIKQEDEMNVDGFRDNYITELIMNELKKAKINIYTNYRFIKWYLYEDSNMIQSVTFGSKFNAITLPCRLFVSFCRKSLSRHYRYIFQRTGLIIDGRLVIDENFKMNDPFIYAAGPITQYKRKLFANNLNHYYYDRFEVGQTLADKFCNHTIFHSIKNQHSDEIPTFQIPLIQRAFLPGGYQYVEITRCGPHAPVNIAPLFPFLRKNYIFIRKNNDENEKELENSINSTEIKIKSEYFRIGMPENGFARTLVCLTKQNNIPLHFLGKLFTMNEKVLNNFVKHFNADNAFDPLEFFTQSWVEVLLHPGFTTIRNKNFEIMLNTLMNDSFISKFLMQHMRAKNKIYFSENDKKSIRNTLDTEKITKMMERNVLKFINDHHHNLSNFKYCQLDIPYFAGILDEDNDN